MLNCLLGMSMPSEKCDVPPVVRASWVLTSNGVVIAKGVSDTEKGGAWANDSIARQIGSFQGDRNRRYVLDLDSTADGPALATTDPHLVVGHPSALREKPFPKDKVFERFIEITRENPGKKIFVHCRLGDDRTGMMIAAYRMGQQHWTAKEAMQEMHEFGYRGIHHLLCPGLGRYEKSFPQSLQHDPLFENLR